MPTRYAIDPARRLVLVTAEGELTDADLLEQRARIRADAGFDPAYSFLVDLSRVSVVSLQGETVRRLASDRISVRGIRRAIVLPPEGPAGTPAPVPYGLGRMYQLAAETQGEDVQVFVDRADAERWLDLPRSES